jgi:DNA-binding Lrp family transcriptional regulator
MDETDKKIIAELAKDVQMPFARIAKRIGVSPDTVRKRYQKMKKEGTIFRSTIIIDLSKIGYQGKAILMITNTPNQDMTTTIDILKKMPNIFTFSEIVGDADVLAIAWVKDLKSIITLVNNIKKAPSVDRVETSFINDPFFPISHNFNKLYQQKEEN